MADKKYIKVQCSKSGAYGLITVESVQGRDVITNFFEIDKDAAANIHTAHEGPFPTVSGNLKPCSTNGSRTPSCLDKSGQCSVAKGELWYQCIYCNKLTACREAGAGGADVYFLMDQSGSMSKVDRKEAAKAVEVFYKDSKGDGNVYSFVAWGSTAGYVFDHETNTGKMSSAIASYEAGTTGHGGSTAAELAFQCIERDVAKSKKPVRIIFVTDGYLDNDSRAIKARNAVLGANSNVEIIAIGTTGADEGVLKQIGTVDAFSKVVGGTDALTSTFADIKKWLKDNQHNG